MEFLLEFTDWMALVPIGCAIVCRRDTAWYWLGVAFAVSWAADIAAHVVDPWLISGVYPLTQAAIIGAVLLPRTEAVAMVTVLVTAALASILWNGIAGPDVLFRTVAFGAVAGIVIDRPALGWLRWSLLIYFGLGLLAWYAYAINPGWTTWGAYQGIRAAGLAVFCYACFRPSPSLRAVGPSPG